MVNITLNIEEVALLQNLAIYLSDPTLFDDEDRVVIHDESIELLNRLVGDL